MGITSYRGVRDNAPTSREAGKSNNSSTTVKGKSGPTRFVSSNKADHAGAAFLHGSGSARLHRTLLSFLQSIVFSVTCHET